MIIEPYLIFEGRCEEAIAFYQQAVDAKLQMKMYFKDSPDKRGIDPAVNDLVMHASMLIGQSRVLMSDGHAKSPAKFEGFNLTLNVKDMAEAERAFANLSKGGQVRMPLAQTFFSPGFGMLADPFGVGWIIMIDASAK